MKITRSDSLDIGTKHLLEEASRNIKLPSDSNPDAFPLFENRVCALQLCTHSVEGKRVCLCLYVIEGACEREFHRKHVFE